MVSAYCSYLVLSAIINHPETRCRPVDDAYDTTLRLVGCVFVFAAVRTPSLPAAAAAAAAVACVYSTTVRIEQDTVTTGAID
jgi:hypothetical protein